MKTLVHFTAAAAAVLTLGVVSTQAQNPAGANATKHGVAVVDISYLFKNHERFKSTMEQMKKEMETIEGELKADREKIALQEQERNKYNVGSAEYKKMDEEIARKMADFNLKMGKLRKEFLEREAKVYYQTYLEVVDAVKYYAKRQNIGLVLRFNGEPVDPNRRDDVLRELAYTAREFDAAEALGYGFVTRLADDPHAAAMDLARAIAGRSPHAIRGIKRLANAAHDTDPRALLEMARQILNAEQWQQFVERRSCDLSRAISGVRCRVNIFQTSRGVGFAVRLLASFQASIEKLNLHPDLRRFATLPHGLVLLSGPTGCGALPVKPNSQQACGAVATSTTSGRPTAATPSST